MTKQLDLRLLILSVAVLVAVLFAACGGGDDSAGSGTSRTDAGSSLEDASSPTGDSGAIARTEVTDAPSLADLPAQKASSEGPRGVPEELTIVWEAWSHLVQDYVDQTQLDADEFAEAALRAMLDILDDSGTYYLSPEVASAFQEDLSGEFEGIGAYVEMNRAGKLIIVNPIEGGPAEAAGIRPGDIVLEADGESLEGLTVWEAVSKIRGPKGTKVRLLVKHLIALDPVEITVQRGVILEPSVRLRSDPGDRFAHIRISDFYANTVDQLRDTIQQVINDGAEGLIIDVRNNPGGTLEAAIDVTSQFLDSGLVMYSIDGDGGRRDWRVRRGGLAPDIPMVVLVNQRSASASEILAGTLQDHNRATIIGASTFGKGSVNNPRSLSNGGAMYITIWHWFTPLGRLIEGDGIEPDIKVTDRDPQEADVKQLERAIQELELITGRQDAEKLSS